jgi:poly(3-hydroxybutyrate) depolymerase
VSVVEPSTANAQVPVLFWFHGSGGDAQKCGDFHGSGELGQLAEKHGFAIVCGEALQDAAEELFGHKGQWMIPEIQTDTTGTVCDPQYDVAYIKGAIEQLRESGGFDTSRLFFSGCSMGSGFSNYIAQCIKKVAPQNVSAFATHSTGLKVKGDGLHFPGSIWHKGVVTGECDGCQYFPSVPVKWSDSLGLKACINDNDGDNISLGDFWTSSHNLATAWKAKGNSVETHWGTGGHCQINSFADIVTCLDDNTGRLFTKSAGLLV